MNKVVLTGRLTKDPDLTYTPSGVAHLRFTLAVDRDFLNANNEREADFVPCEAWRKTAEFVANNLAKGNRLEIVGSWRTGSYEGQDGKRVYTNHCNVESVKPIDWANSNQDGQATQQQPQQQQQQQQTQQQQNYTRSNEDPFANSKGPIEIDSDDLPF